ncbi:MAG TPA: hypothetical protein VGZ73_19900 [Bryobacteraceae bacterium]|jgi:hypothetical protein|nr:hypothetical protein [Bryobacteraceae bacterium]
MTEAANMTREFGQYRQLERRLWFIRWRNAGEESVGEDEVLDEMDRTWLQLSDREQAILRAEGPRCWPMDSSALPPQFADARWVAEPEAWTYEGFDSGAQAILSAGAS